MGSYALGSEGSFAQPRYFFLLAAPLERGRARGRAIWEGGGLSNPRPHFIIMPSHTQSLVPHMGAENEMYLPNWG